MTRRRSGGNSRPNEPAAIQRSITVSLGGREYAIRQLPIRAARGWREKVGALFTQIANLVENADTITLTDPADLARLAGLVQSLAIKAPDVAFDLLRDYSPEIAADRERIEIEAYDDEITAALVEVFKVAYPFGRLWKLQAGLPGVQTSKS